MAGLEEVSGSVKNTSGDYLPRTAFPVGLNWDGGVGGSLQLIEPSTSFATAEYPKFPCARTATKIADPYAFTIKHY
jgi:hypothetical protein